jgi:hypothetical protein
LAPEIAPFGLGVTVLVAGTFRTDILELTESHADHDGPYGPMHRALEAMQPLILRMARPPEQFAAAVERSLTDTAPFVRRGVGPDAHAIIVGNRLVPTGLFMRLVGMALRLPKPGSLRDSARRRRPVTPHTEDGPHAEEESHG